MQFKEIMKEITFLNLEYAYLKIYECITDVCRIGGEGFFDKIKPVLTILILLFIAGTIYSIIRIYQIRQNEKKEFGEIIVAKGAEEKKRQKWNQLLELISSDNHNNWRLAIIEADTILDDMVTMIGHKGEGLGEKLKQIERSDFNTLDQAWEAHKIRNIIAHAGSDYILTQREARRVIDLYRQVFEEFGFI